MTQYWEPGTQYNNGDVVEYEGHRYKIIQPHRAQSDWAPPITPALWGRLQDQDSDSGRNQQQFNQPPSYQQPQGQPQQSWKPDHKVEPSKEDDKHWYDIDEKRKKQLEIGGGIAAGAALLGGAVAYYKHHDKEKVEKEQQQQQQQLQASQNDKHWYDIDDKRKKQLEIGGGLVAAGALAAGGTAYYKHHEKEKAEQEKYNQQQQGHSDYKGEPANEGQHGNRFHIDDERKKQLEIAGGVAAGAAVLGGGYALYKGHEKSENWKRDRTAWENDAKQRSDRFYAQGPTGPATWVLAHGKKVPQGAIEVSKEHSWSLYICRAYHEGGIQVGKASDAFTKGAVIGFKQEEIHLDTYEILLGNMNGLRWVHSRGQLNPASLGYRPVEGGREDDGTLLYIAKAEYNGVYHPGKASAKLDGAYIPYGGTEKNIKDYHVLCYN